MSTHTTGFYSVGMGADTCSCVLIICWVKASFHMIATIATIAMIVAIAVIAEKVNEEHCLHHLSNSTWRLRIVDSCFFLLIGVEDVEDDMKDKDS